MKLSVIKVAVLLTTSAFWMCATAAAQTSQNKSTSSGKAVTGCLSGPNSEGAYVLKPAKGRAFEVGGNDELKNHVGHTVKLTGNWVKSGSQIGESESAEKNEKNEKGESGEHRGVAERHFKVTDIQHISDTCSQSGSGMKGMKH